MEQAEWLRWVRERKAKAELRRDELRKELTWWEGAVQDWDRQLAAVERLETETAGVAESPAVSS